MTQAEGTGLIHGYFEYPLCLRHVGRLLRLRRRVRRLRPEALVYLAAPRGRIKVWRDAFFFRACGIRRLIGVPFDEDQQRPRAREGGFYEYEGARLARCLQTLGDVNLDAPNAFGLELSDHEHQAAVHALGPLSPGGPLLVISIGAKADVKDWEDANWAALLRRLGTQLSEWGLAMLGGADERGRSDFLLEHWPGPRVNLCGRLSVRESAALLTRARVYLGHDSGPMHLAAAVGTPCVAVFSSRNLRGEWFPYGKGHRVLYHPISCQGCRLDVCLERGKACIRSITVDEVARNTLEVVKQTQRGAARL